MPAAKTRREKKFKAGMPRQALAVTDPRREIQWTDQQKLFVKEWAAGNSISSSAARAGYTDGAAYAYTVLVKHPDVIAVYEAEKAKYEKQSDMSRQKVMDMLQEAYDMAKLMADPQAMVAAAREVGKMCGYYAPTTKTIKIEGNMVMEKLDRMSDAELLELVHGANEQISAAVAEVVREEEAENDDAQALD
jgi:phage terminase small subunit